ncbi:O-antigen ligase family protein [Microbacterium sp. KSW4-11]|uniref:O-antigen ligase family protein n=1 Tax=Microbacterium gawkjiense TaxID=3067309 RepID=A0ABU3GDG4_9MICO|nr:O-antigen ligase family protein [Microbacterium sp. KSW4-11]MDT3316725.1 O-antigen ligase family protein [Microbacterium sp. KSW4-11]
MTSPRSRFRDVLPPVIVVLIGGAAYFTGIVQLIPIAIALALFSVVVSSQSSALAAAFASIVLPLSYLDLPGALRVLQPFVVLPLLVFALRGRLRIPNWLGLGPIVVGAAFVAYSSIVAATTPFGPPEAALVWVVSLAVAFVVVPSCSGVAFDVRPILAVLAVLSCIYGLVAILEFTTRSNALSGFFAASPVGLSQKWDAYRSMTSIGHPLLNGTVFAVCASGGLSALLQTGRLRWLVVTGIPLLAVFTTGSRSAVLACVAGSSVAILCLLLSRARGPRGRAFVAVIAGAVVLAVAGSGFLVESGRGVVEASGSAQLRFDYLQLLAPLVAISNGLGTGAGLSHSALLAVGGAYAQYPLESSALQALVSLGVPGFSLLVIAVGWIMIASARRGAVIGPAMFAAYVVAASGFNLLEAFPAALVIPMTALSLSIMEAQSFGREPDATPGPHLIPGATRRGVRLRAGLPARPEGEML